MTIGQLDLLMRAGGPFLLVFIAAILIRDSRRELAARLFIPLALCLSAFIVTNSDGPEIVSDRVETVLNLFAGWTVPFLWWFCLAMFDRSFRVSGAVAWIGAAWIGLAAVNRGWLGADLTEPSGAPISIVIGLAIVGHVIWHLLVDRRDDLVDRRRRLRPLVALILAAQLLLDLLVDLFLGVGWQRDWFAISQNIALISFVTWLGWLSLRSSMLTAIDGSNDLGGIVSRLPPAAADPQLVANVRNLMESKKVFLDPGLTFARFVSLAGFSERAVRHYINHELGYDHFRSFLNARRVAEACRRLDDPTHQAEKLIAIAYDSGFASLASFNRTFLATTGRTPTEFRRGRQMAAFEERLASF